MIAVLAFLKSPLAKYAGVALVCLALALGLRHSGVMAERHAWEAKAEKAARQARRTEAAGQKIALDLRAANDGEKVRIEYRTKTLIQKVHDVIPQALDCPIPDPAVGLLNAAISGSDVPAPASGPVSTAPPVATSDLLENSIFNAGVAQKSLAENRAWREWYARESALYIPH